jgi:anti-anti-sigma factor
LTTSKEEALAEPATVDDLGAGDHACLTFSDADECLDIVAAFVRDGLDEGDKVLCLTDALAPAELSGELADRGLPVRETLSTGQLEVAPSVATYINTGCFDAAQVIDTLRTRIDSAAEQGYPGLRIAVDMLWALRPVTGLEQLISYETELTGLLANGRATAVCQYDRAGFDAVTLAGLATGHGRMVAAVTYHSDAVLRICRQHIPPGVRVAGEMDFRAVDAFARALGEAMRIDGHIFLNMSQLRFIDVAAAGVVVQTGLNLRPDQRMTVVCQQPVGKVLRSLGADHLSSLRVVSRDVG